MSNRPSKVITFLEDGEAHSPSKIHGAIIESGEQISLVTVRRMLKELVAKGILEAVSDGRSRTYKLTMYGKITADVSVKEYLAREPDKRWGARTYNLELFPSLLFDPFSTEEKRIFEEATTFYRDRSRDISPVLHQKELERFVIELSWKSSKIEGNTYTLLDTERLLLYGIEAPGHAKEEAQMILNHKAAFQLVYENRDTFKTLGRSNMEEVHKVIVRGLGVQNNLRKSPVGVVGSMYRPLDNEYQIAEAVDALAALVNQTKDAYAKALFSLLGVSYIQPFEDGNKRTARLMANALLLAHDLAPLSYRSVDEESYRGSLLVFYELNSLVAFKRLFVEQYKFSAHNYLVG